MQGSSKSDSNAPPFVLATRLYVHYKFKTRQTFEPATTLTDDQYAREVLKRVRAVGDVKLREMADRFEAVRFPSAAAAQQSPPQDSAPAAPLKDRPFDMLLLDEG